MKASINLLKAARPKLTDAVHTQRRCGEEDEREREESEGSRGSGEMDKDKKGRAPGPSSTLL